MIMQAFISLSGYWGARAQNAIACLSPPGGTLAATPLRLTLVSRSLYTITNVRRKFECRRAHHLRKNIYGGHEVETAKPHSTVSRTFGAAENGSASRVFFECGRARLLSNSHDRLYDFDQEKQDNDE